MSQNPKDGSQKCSHLALTSKKHSPPKNSSSTAEFSKYFTKKRVQTKILPENNENPMGSLQKPTENANFQFDDSDSPYKNLIKTNPKVNLNDSASDEADFRSPIFTRKPNKLQTKLTKNPVQKTRSKSKASVKKSQLNKFTTSKNFAAKVITDHFKYFGENPEHMQMAMALSKSAYEAECGTSCPSPMEEETPDIGALLHNSKPTLLEMFGFSKKTVIPVENRRAPTIPSTATKKTTSRLKFINPTLSIRTNEERKSLIESKISLTLIQCQTRPSIKITSEHTVLSNILNNYISKEQSIFNLDNIYHKNSFYVKCLDLPQSKYKCGYLLKDWSTIPGRDKSPSKVVKKTSAEEKSSIYQEEETEVSSKTISNKSQDSIAKTPKKIGSITSPHKISPIQQVGEALSVETSCKITISTITEKTILRSFTSESKDSGVTSSFTSSAKSTIPSFSSSGRSVSPNLFDSDDEIDQFLNKIENVPESVSKKNTSEVLNHSYMDNRNSTEETMENPCEELSFKKTLSDEVIDLTESDNEISLNESKISSCDKKTNIYNLDEFEEDDNFKMDLSPDNMNDFNDGTANVEVLDLCYNDDVNNQSTDTLDNKKNNNIELKTLTKNASVCSDFDNATTSTNSNSEYVKIIDKSNIKDIHCTNFNSNRESCDYVHKLVHSSSDSHLDNLCGSYDLNISNKNDKMQSEGSSNETPKRNQRLKRSSSFHTRVSCNKNAIYCTKDSEKNDLNRSNKNLNMKETPKKSIENKGSKSPYFDEPIFYDSSDLNVTDYVNNMLNQDNFSFNEIEHINDDEEMSLSQCSQSSVILDEELNYSSHFATPSRKQVNDKREKTKCSYDEEDENSEHVILLSPDIQQHDHLEREPQEHLAVVNSEVIPEITNKKRGSTPNNFIIKTDNVTPMPDYDSMATPAINKELQKFGVKPLKRTRGAKLLKYIYESTHPLVGRNENVSDHAESDEDQRIIKRRKKGKEQQGNLESLGNSSSVSNPICGTSVEIIGDKIIESEKTEDLIFERKQSARIPSCKVPLQIVWYNFVNSHPAIKENILLYEPLQLESLHMMLKEQGFKFHIQDLISFLDKKCITIRTAQKQRKMNR